MRNSVSASQAGQDCWIYGEVFNEQTGGFFLDIGAHNGVDISNTFILEARYGWKGICIEANPLTFPELKKNRKCKCINTCIDNKEGEVNFVLDGVCGGILADDCDNVDSDKGERNIVSIKTQRLTNLLDSENAPREIDYLSIDIEGAEDRALLNFDFDKYIFRCISIERPSKELRLLLTNKKYILVKEIPGLDCFFVHSSFVKTYTQNIFYFYNKKFLTKKWK